MNRLQQLREAAALSRADLSRRSDISQSVIEQLENGAHLEEAERAVLVPGETPVEDIAVILNKLADALGADLIKQGVTVTPDELVGPAKDDLPAEAEVKAEIAEKESTLPNLPLNGVTYPAEDADLPPDARSHNETETPDDIDAALSQMAINSQITASETAAETGIDEVKPEGDWPEEPVSPAAETASDSAPDYTEPPSGGQQPTGGTETINMAELPDTLPIAVLPDSPSVVETEEISPITGKPEDEGQEFHDQEFASQETQEIYIPPEVLAQLPDYNKISSGDVSPTAPDSGDQATQQFELPGDIQNLPGQTEQIDVPAENTSDAATMKFDLSAVREQYAQQTADEPSAIVMAEDAAAESAEPAPPLEVEETREAVEPVPGTDGEEATGKVEEDAPTVASPAIAEVVGTLEPDPEPVTEVAPTDAPTVSVPVVSASAETSDDYEAVPMPDMPGPAPAPETMETESEAHPQPPDMEEVAKEDAAEAATVTLPTVTVSGPAIETDLGVHTAHGVDAVTPNLSAPPVPHVEPTPLEVEQATPAQDDAPLTTVEEGKEPSMKPYVSPQPAYAPPQAAAQVSMADAARVHNASAQTGAATTGATPSPVQTPAPVASSTAVSPEAKAEDNRYRLPPSTVIPSVVGVVLAVGWYAWRSWRRSREEAERVAPYYKKK